MPKFSSLARTAVIAVGLLGLGACSNMDDLQQRMVSGGATGAIVGTVGTVLTGGCIPCGTAIGGAVGIASGYVMDKLDKNTKSDSSSTSTTTSSANSPAYTPSSN